MHSIALNKADLYCVIYDNNVRFEHQGELIGILTDNGSIKWLMEISESIKKECRNFIKSILTDKCIIVTS